MVRREVVKYVRALLWLFLGAGWLSSPVLADQNPTDQNQNLWQTVSFPVDHFSRISSRFGHRSSATGGEGQEFHNGLDLAAPAGSYIRSWAAGTVKKVEYDSRCGWHVIVESGPWTHLYCHIQAVGVEPGSIVEAGQVIAAVGSTGRSTGPHLHWTLRYQGELINPEQVLEQMQAAWSQRP
jgi:murein DD-endopeptidase MepM/ murein hydrolase activator NlpD